MTWQAGNAFDTSTLLVSLLIGVGYDAYCVCGYASKEITQYDHSNIPCPFLTETQTVRVFCELMLIDISKMVKI